MSTGKGAKFRDVSFSEIRWARGPRCPFCPRKTRVARLRGKKHRDGLYKCYACRRQFSATIGTPFADSHLSDEQIGRALAVWRLFKPWGRVTRIGRAISVGYRTAWHLAKRIEAWERRK